MAFLGESRMSQSTSYAGNFTLSHAHDYYRNHIWQIVFRISMRPKCDRSILKLTLNQRAS
jgi:hypothetical protein